jgi:transcriptional regulator with XRE-family HTH domain
MPYYGGRVRAARGYAGLTQDALAQALGVDPATIKRREAPRGAENYKPPKKGERIAIAQICGIPPEFMEEGFGGRASDEISEQLAQMRAQIQDLHRELVVHELEEPERTETTDQPAGQTQPEQQQ